MSQYFNDMASQFTLPVMTPEMESHFHVTRWQHDKPYPQDVMQKVVFDIQQLLQRIDNDKIRSEIYGLLEHMKQKIAALNNVDRHTQLQWMEDAHNQIDQLRQEYQNLRNNITGGNREGFRWGWGGWGGGYYPWYGWARYNPYTWYYYRPYYWNFA